MRSKDLEILQEKYQVVNENWKSTTAAILIGLAGLYPVKELKDKVEKYAHTSPDYVGIDDIQLEGDAINVLQMLSHYGDLRSRDSERKLGPYLEQLQSKFPSNKKINDLIYKIKINNRMI